jgi:phage gp36-like protein
MSYAQPTDMIARYPGRDLIDLTDENGQAVNTTTLQSKLNDASVEIDTYLESRFTLPFTDVPAILNQVACDIAMYRLQVLRPMHDVTDAKDRYDRWVKWLDKVRDGKITLGLTVTSKEPTIANPTVLLQSTSAAQPGNPPSSTLMNRVSLRGY